MAWVLASTSIGMLSSPVNAACIDNSPFSFLADAGSICAVSKNYLSFFSGVPALWARSSAVITWPNGATSPPPALGTVLATNTPAVTADTGGGIQLTGGSIDTDATGSAGALAGPGGSIQLTGTTIVTHLDDSPGLAVNGAGGSLTATGVVVKTDLDRAFGASNGYGSGPSAGGAMTLANTNILTLGQDAHGVASGAGSTTTLGPGNVLNTQGDGAIGLYATAGGVVMAQTGTTTISTYGGKDPMGLGAYGAEADGLGSQISFDSLTVTTSGAGATGLFASDRASSGSAGSISVTGTLNISTTNTAAAAVALQGNGASIVATGGGSILSAGDAIEFLGGNNQTATFDNFNIANRTGDLIFADPSVATINFSSTIANAGTGVLLNATLGSVVTLNANASSLTGTIQTDAASKNAVNLTNGSSWTMTGPSTISNLALTNSVVIFAPPGSGVGFKTLTLNNYSGLGANISMTVALGGSGSPGDQIVINGGTASGLTLLSIHNAGGTGGQTAGLGIPLILAVKGGTTSANAFALNPSAPVVAGGYRYVLQESGQDWYLVSTPASTQNDIANSVTNLAKSIEQQIITGRVLQSILLGATEQVNCSNCSSGFGSAGSYALGAHGRWALTDEVILMGGFSYDEYSASDVTVTNAPTFAGSVIYDPVNFGRSRPFLEIGGGLVPYEQVQYSRPYQNGLTPSVGEGSGVDRSFGLFGRIGWVDRVTPIDEAAVYTDISRSWLSAGGYTEATSAVNPFPATVQTGIDTLNVARLGGQYTHLFNGKVEVNISAAAAYGFGAGIASQWDISGFGPLAPYPIANSVWCEWGARVGYRVAQRIVIDTFAVGTFGGEVGTTFHGGIGLRYLF
jgi:fibronectin-binding autotransporter adhesin